MTKPNNGADDQDQGKKDGQSDGQNGGDSGSGDGQGQGQPKLYKTPDGRELTADQVAEEYSKLNQEFTRKSQKLAELEKKAEHSQDSADDDAVAKAKAELKKLGVVLQEDFEKTLGEREQKVRQTMEFEQKLKDLEKELNGSDGRPTFKREEVVAYMEKSGTIFDPWVAYKEMHGTALDEWKIKQYLEKKSSTDDGTGESRSDTKPDKSGDGKGKEFGKMTEDELNQAIVDELTQGKGGN